MTREICPLRLDREAVEAVVSVLKAPDLYAAIGAQRDASAEDIRRCYLQAAIKVHPHKNKHEDAARAFQYASFAVLVLNHSSLRERYDHELQAGQVGTASARESGWCKPNWRSLSPDDALGIFAVMTATCSGAATSDLGDTLSEAQQYLSQQRQNDLMRQPTSTENGTGDFHRTAEALVFSAALWTCGAVLQAHGLPYIGSSLERLAFFKGVSHMMSASQNPEVRALAASSAESVFKDASNMADRVLEGFKDIGESLPSCSTSWETLKHSFSNTYAVEDQVSEKEWPSKTVVRLVGLSKAPHLNGRIGVITGKDEASGRIKVRLFKVDDTDAVDTSTKLVMASNLKCAAERSESPPASLAKFF